MSEPRIVILGAGPAGVGAAYQLRRKHRARVTVLEQNSVVGGNAGSFEAGGQRLDYGSHRLHPACEPELLEDIRTLLGGDLLDRPRHGRINLRGKMIHFPLKPADLLLKLDKGFAAGTLKDMATKALWKNGAEGDTFASVLMANLGPTICHDFYFPYAWKIWGRDPATLSGIQARRRVSAGSFLKLIKKVLSAVPGFKPKGSGRFFYPRKGFGQISEAYADEAKKLGAEFLMGWKVTRMDLPASEKESWKIHAEKDGETRVVEADYVWSTIPITLLARAMSTGVPDAVKEAGKAIDYRSMILVYLELDVDQFTEYDAHYFPASNIRITRLSEPKNYAALTEPRGRTTLCAELPCSPNDPWWSMTDEELGKLVMEDLATAGIPVPRPPVRVHARRLRQAYPIYTMGYEVPFGLLDHWVEQVPRLLSYGRQGLFAHDNTHHALYMAYSAVDCLEDGRWNEEKWRKYREIFATHVVED